jgi:reactive chlorine resistance protein C
MTAAMERRRTTATTSEVAVVYSSAVQVAAAYLLRYGLVLVIAWIGFMKFAAYEAAGIQPLMSHSLLMSWVYASFSERALAALLCALEVASPR